MMIAEMMIVRNVGGAPKCNLLADLGRLTHFKTMCAAGTSILVNSSLMLTESGVVNSAEIIVRNFIHGAG